MYTDSQTYFRDVPVSVTMEDDPKSSPRDGSDTDQGPKGAARLLQVTMGAASEEPEPKEEEYVLQPPISNEQALEGQIQRDFDGLTQAERQQVYYDMRGEIFKGQSNSTESAPRIMEETSNTMDAPVSASELESLDRELHRLLSNPAEQESNPLYQAIGKTLSASGSDFYANSTSFRSKLLRAEHRDISKAAKRTADYLSLLHDLFGEKMLSRPIKLSDLTATERQLQRKGYQQLFRFRDQAQHKQHEQQKQQQQPEQQPSLQDLDNGAGRRIAGSFDLCRCVNTTEPATDDETAKTRVLLYLMQVASEDEETQIQGIVFIFMLALRAVATTAPSNPPPPPTAPPSQPSTTPLPRTESDNIFAHDSNSESDQHSDEQLLAQLQFSPHETTHKHNHTMSRVKVLSKLFRSGPLRVSAIHVCSPSRPELHQIKLDCLKTLSKHERVRTRFHDGTSMECSLSLNKVGIPTDRLPLKYDGTIKTEDHLQWIAIQEAKESAAKHKRAFDIVECPMNMDILSGRGQLVRSHPGNVSFRKDFIRARSVRYDMASNREEKNAIADEILDDIATLKRKFLKQHQGAGYWTELDKKTAKEKVMMAFREFRKSQRNQQQQQQLRKARSQRPSLPLSQSLPHSPVTQPQQLRRSQPRSPSIPPTRVVHEGQAPQQPSAPEGQHPGGIHYQLYPPPPPTQSVPGLGASTEGFFHPQSIPQGVPPGMPPPPYYAHHPHMAYGHPPPIPPHLLHHRPPYPPPPHEEGAEAPPTGTAPPLYPAAAAPSLVSYHHPSAPPPPNYFPPEAAANIGSRPSSRQSRSKGSDEGDERSYKRYKAM